MAPVFAPGLVRGRASAASVLALALATFAPALAGCGDPGGFPTPPPTPGTGGGDPGGGGGGGAAGNVGRDASANRGSGGRAGGGGGGEAGGGGGGQPQAARDGGAGRGGAGGAVAIDAGRSADAPRGDAPVGPSPRADGGSPIDVPPGGLALGARCENPGGELLRCADGNICCKPCCEGKPAVCTRPVSNDAGIGVGKCPLPDLAVNLKALQDNLGSGPMTFPAMSCETREQCVDMAGRRNTLHFEVTTPNIGTADLILGDPKRQPGFEFASCHDHYHFEGYALYQLLDAAGNEVIRGNKRAFCLMDSSPAPGYPLTRRRQSLYDCDRQGISAGWGDTYDNGLDCQFMDVSGVAPGRYKLRVTVNPTRILPELSFDNNAAEVEVQVGAVGTSPMDPCVGMVKGNNRECGWRSLGSQSCTPGARVTVGCGADCGLGRSTGDPMLRVCTGDEPCAHPGLGNNDDCDDGDNGSLVRFTCPSSGRYTVLSATSSSEKTSTCEMAVR